jgi:hypothetical protein
VAYRYLTCRYLAVDRWNLSLALCPEGIVFLSRGSAKAWKRFLCKRGIPVETNRFKTTHDMLVDPIFKKGPLTLSSLGSNIQSVAEEINHDERNRQYSSSSLPPYVQTGEKVNTQAQSQVSSKCI